MALKILKPAITSELTIARFEREVQITSHLTHPNTVAVYDYGHTAEGLFYYAMEYLDGINLHDLVLRFGPMPAGRVIHVMRQMCGSLAEAHGLGLVHRDISPRNVLLNQRGGLCDVVKVLDFGLVKAIDSDMQRSLTLKEVVFGTPKYMSPEALYRSDAVDARSDLYSLGALGYFLLTGRPPFEAETLPALIERQNAGPPSRPSQIIGMPVAPELETLVLGCLSKEQSGRPASASALEEALAQCAPANPWTREQAVEWWQKHLPKTKPLFPSALQERTVVIKTETPLRDEHVEKL